MSRDELWLSIGIAVIAMSPIAVRWWQQRAPAPVVQAESQPVKPLDERIAEQGARDMGVTVEEWERRWAADQQRFAEQPLEAPAPGDGLFSCPENRAFVGYSLRGPFGAVSLYRMPMAFQRRAFVRPAAFGGPYYVWPTRD